MQPAVQFYKKPLPSGLTIFNCNLERRTTPAASILTLLNVLYPNGSSNASGSFVDIGSGQGIPCLAAALSGRFSIAKGIECQPKWYESAVLLKEVYDENQDAKDACTLEFHCDDATKPAGHLEGSSCVFLNSVTFDAKFCQQLGHRIESDLAREKTAGDDIFVVSLSRRLPLPSFDLVDILRLNANGEGMYTFYVNRKANTQSTFYAITDSEIMRALRDNDLVGSLVAIARGHADERLGLSLLAALAGSEPVVRQYMCCPVLLERLETSIDSKLATLTQKALGSMVLRAMSDHPVGRSAIAKSDSLLDELLAGISTDEEHPALRANFLDIFSQLLYDSPLDRISVELNETTERLQEDNAALVSDNLREALAETIAMRRWWDGHKLEISNSR